MTDQERIAKLEEEIKEMKRRIAALESFGNRRDKDIERALQQSDPRFNNWNDPHSR